MSKIEQPRQAGVRGKMRADAGQEQLAASARPGELVGYFGYGSLVNRATLAAGVVAAIPARLAGWRRTWRPRPDMGPTPGVTLPDGLTPSLLTAHRAEDASIDGLLVIDLAVNLSVIDAREFRYHRRDITLAELTFDADRTERDTGLRFDPGARLHIYEARSEHPETVGPSPILRSYLDAVMQGFLNEFGEGGVHRFVAETGAFHMPIHEDRHRPLYPRAVTLSPREMALFDAALAPCGAKDRR